MNGPEATPGRSLFASPPKCGLAQGTTLFSYWRAFNGQLNDIRIYNRALPEAAIASVQSSGMLVDNAALKLWYNFDTAPVGTNLSCPVRSLQSSPILGRAFCSEIAAKTG